MVRRLIHSSPLLAFFTENLEAIADLDNKARRRAGPEFEHVSGGYARGYDFPRLWFGIVGNGNNTPIFVGKKHIEWDEGVLHPHVLYFGIVEQKKHSSV